MPNDAFYYLFPQKIVDFCSFSFRLKIIFSFSLQEKLQGARHVEHFTKTKVGATGGACRGVSSTRLSLSLSAHFYYSCTHSGRLLESLDTNKCTFQPATEAFRNLSFFGAKIIKVAIWQPIMFLAWMVKYIFSARVHTYKFLL